MYYKPIFVMYEEGVTEEQQEVVFYAIAEILKTMGVSSKIPVYNKRVWRSPDWIINSKLVNYNSIDWYLATAQAASSRKQQIEGGQLLELLTFEPWQDQAPHFDVVITRRDMYANNWDFCIGLARRDVCTVISIHHFLSLPHKEMLECIKTEALHELGHVFGLIPEIRTDKIEQSLGKHCTNRCVMRQGLQLPGDWQKMTRDRLKHGSFCETCRQDLRKYFQ